MRLLMITQDFPPVVGGIQTYSFELSRRLAARCEHFELVAPYHPRARRVDPELPFTVHRLPVTSDGMAAATLLAWPWLTRRSFDAVFHVQWYTVSAGLLARAAGRVRKVFVAAHGRELLLNVLSRRRLLGPAFVNVRRGLAGRVDGWFPVSAFTAGVLQAEGVDPSRMYVVPNGVDPDARKPGSRSEAFRLRHGLGDAPLLLTLSRLVPRKGIDTVLYALVDVARAIPEVRYAIAGAGPDRPRLEALAHALGLDDHVVFVGRVADRDLNDCLTAADVFVMPARSDPPDVEGFGLVFLEASACERPVVGARAGGIPDAIVEGETGLLVNPDDVAELAVTLTTLLSDRERALEMGRRGRARVLEECHWDRAADRVLRGMSEVLSCGSS